MRVLLCLLLLLSASEMAVAEADPALADWGNAVTFGESLRPIMMRQVMVDGAGVAWGILWCDAGAGFGGGGFGGGTSGGGGFGGGGGGFGGSAFDGDAFDRGGSPTGGETYDGWDKPVGGPEGPDNLDLLVVWDEEQWKPVRLNGLGQASKSGMSTFTPGPDGSLLFLCNDPKRIAQVYNKRASSLSEATLRPEEEEEGPLYVIYDSLDVPWAVRGTSLEFFLHPRTLDDSVMTIRSDTPGGKYFYESFRWSVNPFPFAKDALGRFWLLGQGLALVALQEGARPLMILDPAFNEARAPQAFSDPWFERLQFSISDGTDFRFSTPVTTQDAPADYPMAVSYCAQGPVSVRFTESGLWDIDPHTFQGTRLKLDTEAPLDATWELWYAGDQRYCLLGKMLYAEAQDGAWTAIADSVDRSYSGSQAIVVTPEYSFLAAQSPPLWILPAGGGKAMSLNWQRGIGWSRTMTVGLLADGRLMLHGEDAEPVVKTPAELVEAAMKPVESDTFQPNIPLVQSSTLTVFGVMPENEQALYRWQDAWEILRPDWGPGVVPADIEALAVDSQGGVWCLQGSPPACAVYSDMTGEWEFVATYTDALNWARSRNIALTHCTAPGLLPVSGPDGQAAFYSADHVQWFDGGAWHTWTLEEATGQKGMLFDRPAFFGEDGRLRVGTWKETWAYDAADGWHAIAFEPGHHPPEHSEKPKMDCEVPPQRHQKTPEAVVRDRLGVCWVYWTSDNVFRRALGENAQVTLPTLNWRDRFQLLDEVLIDASGDIFLHSALYEHRYVFLRAKEPLPDTTASEPRATANGFEIDVTSDQAEAQFTWRIADGEWAAAEAGPLLALPQAVSGKSIEVAALLKDLQIDPTPAALQLPDTFKLQALEEAPIDEWVAQLSSKNYSEREKAVELLVTRPEEARTALQAARPGADTELRWWIDAVLQRIAPKEESAP